MLRQRIQQFRVSRRIRLPHIVLGINDAAIEEMFPVAIHQRARKEAVVLRCEPVRQRQARIVVHRKLQRWRSQPCGLHGLFRFLICGRWRRALHVNQIFARLAARFAADLREKRREAVIILLAPFFERMMMALRALQSLPQE